MRKKAIFLMMALALASTPAMLAQEAADTTFVFKDIKVNPTTSVKDQNKSGTCWSFSGVSFLEDELLPSRLRRANLRRFPSSNSATGGDTGKRPSERKVFLAEGEVLGRNDAGMRF